MTELKTLKDLRYSSHCPSCRIITINPTELRQEAIKWIKAFKNGDTHTDYVAETITNENVQDWIQEFFNITDEDLK